MNTPLFTLKAGSLIENYQIHRVLGVGGFGITYQAQDLNLNCKVAIKEYFPHGLAVRDNNGLQVSPRSDKDASIYDFGLQRFMDEARTLAQFKSQNIVRIARYLEKNGTAYIIMDYEEGVPLSRYLMRCRRLSESEVKNVFRPVLRGLRIVHEKRFLHRDIKPSNIYLRQKGTPVLLDFGAARQSMSMHGRTMTSLGTHGYAPMEQFTTSEKQGPWSDIYGAGATIYHCLTGEAPASALDRISAIQNGRPDPMPSAISLAKKFKYSPELLECVDWMLSLRSCDRPQGLDEVIPVFSITHSSARQTILTETDVDWDAELVAQAERHLARYLGPLATTLVKQCMSKSTSVDELYQLLSSQIDLPTERENFLRSVQASAPLSARLEQRKALHKPPAAPRTVNRQIDARLEQRLVEQLASHIGPLATMLVRDAVSQGSDLDDIVNILCKELPSDAQRETFRKNINS